MSHIMILISHMMVPTIFIYYLKLIYIYKSDSTNITLDSINITYDGTYITFDDTN
jgi:hypothetical protein